MRPGSTNPWLLTVDIRFISGTAWLGVPGGAGEGVMARGTGS